MTVWVYDDDEDDDGCPEHGADHCFVCDYRTEDADEEPEGLDDEDDELDPDDVEDEDGDGVLLFWDDDD